MKDIFFKIQKSNIGDFRIVTRGSFSQLIVQAWEVHSFFGNGLALFGVKNACYGKYFLIATVCIQKNALGTN